MFSHNFQTMCSVISRISSKSIFKMRPPIRPFNDIKYEDIPDVSSANIKKVLKAHTVPFEEGYTNYIIGCPVCKKTPKTAPRAYINKTTGMFMCMGCKYSGQWDSLESCITNKRSRAKSKTDSVSLINKAEEEYQKLNQAIKDICDNTSNLKTLTPEEVEKILKKFKLPIVTQSVLELLDIRIDKDKKNLYFPLENAESEIVGYKVISINVDQAKTVPSLHCGGLLTGKQPKGKDLAILVPNISDFLVLLKSKVSCSVICLPNSVNSLPTVVLPSLERYKKLVLWLGDDVKSWDSARHFAKKLGEKRCYFIRPSEKQPLPHLDENQDFKSLINGAHTIWHKSITTFASLREDVLLELQNIDKVQGVKWKRFPTLSKILKGHRRGELTIITGPTGSGKTTFISEYSLDLAVQGVNTLWGSFEIRNQRLARTMLQQLAGIPLDENLNLFDKWADEFEKLPIYFMTFHGQQPIKVVMEAVDHATYVYDIAHVIIDNVQFMMGLSEEQKHMDRFWKQDLIIAAFRDFATRKNCHVSLVIHPRKERDEEDLSTSSIFGSAKASQEADNVLIIQDKRLTSIKGKKYLQVAKNRYSGDLGIMTLDFDKSGLSFATKKKIVKSQAIKQETEQPKEEQIPV